MTNLKLKRIIVVLLRLRNQMSFEELKNAIPQCSPAALTNELRELHYNDCICLSWDLMLKEEVWTIDVDCLSLDEAA